jgi:putative FmdB family regulatory protein
MPTYEYACKKCGLVFEEFQSITSPPLTKCKKAGCDGQVRRLISPGAGFLFKGSGFYQTDYRSDSYTKAAKSADGPAPAASASGPAKQPESGSASAPAKQPKNGSAPNGSGTKT